MPSISLTDPTAHTLADAGIIATNNGNLRTLLNSGLDPVNLKGNPALASGECAVWNGSAWDRSSVTNLGRTSLAQVTRKSPLSFYPESTTPGSEWPDALTKTVLFYWVVPDDYVSGDATFKVLIRSNTVGNQFRLSRAIYRFRDGVAYSSVEAGTFFNFAISATLNVSALSSATITAANFQAGDVIRLDISRVGGDGNDTNTGMGSMDGAWIEYLGRA